MIISSTARRTRDTTELRGRHPLSGAVVANLSPALAEDLNIDATGDGVIVTAVKPNSNADELGLRVGDILISIDGQEVKESRDVQSLAKPRKYYWPLVILRKGERITSRIGG